MHNFDIINKIEVNLFNFEDKTKDILQTTLNKLYITQSVELTLNIVNNHMISEINEKYRNKKGPTDVISFALEEEENLNLNSLTGFRILGDIFISYEKAKEQAKQYEHSLFRELSFLFLHGLLHLLGYDHQTKEQEKIMFNLQNQILNKLQITRELKEME